MNVFVTDAATRAGVAIVEELSARGHAVTAAVLREGMNGGDISLPGVQWTHSVDESDPQSLLEAMQGCEALVLAVPLAENMKKVGSNAIKAASKAGVRHVVSISCMGASFDAHWRLGREYGFVDLMAEESGIPFTVLRPNMFMQEVFENQSAIVREESVIRMAHGDAQVSFMDANDLGTCVCSVLEAGGEHAGKTYALTGPEPLSGQDLAGLLTDAAQKEVGWEGLAEAEYSQTLVDAGVAPWVVEMLVSRSRIIRRDMAWNATGAVQFLTGNQPKTFAEFAREHAGELR